MRKDLTLVARNNGVRVPLLAAPVVILVLLPVLLVAGQALLADSVVPIGGGGSPFERLTPELQGELTGTTGPGQWAIFVLEYFLAPLYLLVPLVVATVIAADSFAGERERRTLEALLHTPTTDDELLIAKMLSAWLPAVTVGIAGFAVYIVVANVLGWPTVGYIFFPSATWVALAFWVTPAIAGLGLGIIVLVSSHVQSLQAAHQIGSLVVLPLVILVIAQVTGAVFFSFELVVLAGSVLFVLDALLLFVGHTAFRRSELASRL